MRAATAARAKMLAYYTICRTHKGICRKFEMLSQFKDMSFALTRACRSELERR